MDHTKERAAGTCTPRRRRRRCRAHGFIRILYLGIFFAVVCLEVCGAKVHEEPMSALEPAKQPEKQAAEPIQPERSSVSPDDWTCQSSGETELRSGGIGSAAFFSGWFAGLKAVIGSS